MNIEKLSLELLAPYFPYRLRFIDQRDHSIYDLVSIYDESYSLYSEEYPSISPYFEPNHYPDIKPILRPMSDIIVELSVWIKDNKIMRFENDSLKYIQWWLKEVISIKNEIPYLIAIKIFELHGDIFSLIEKGLAIDINTV